MEAVKATINHIETPYKATYIVTAIILTTLLGLKTKAYIIYMIIVERTQVDILTITYKYIVQSSYFFFKIFNIN